MAKNAGLTNEEVAKAFDKCGNVLKTAKYLGVARSTVQHHLDQLGIRPGKELAGGSLDGDIKERSVPLPAEGQVKRYLLTCAQSNTYLNDNVWDTLLGIAKYYGAELHISRFSYNKGAYLNRGNLQKPGAFEIDEEDDYAFTDDHKMWFDPRIVKYASDTRLELAPGLVFCGEMNILPTAVRPLSSLESYTGRKSSIVPHVKFAMESIASANREAPKFMYTTGTVTFKNYIQKKAGQKAEFHHCYGALLVEVNSKGDWWVRQLNADRRGRIYDLGDRNDGVILFHGKDKPKFQQRVEGINWGDIHVSEALYDPEVIELNWGTGGMLDVLKPKFQFGHDTFSFLSRNHHDEKDAHRNFEKFVNGEDSVEGELVQTGNFINDRMVRPWCKVIIVDSNHDRALKKWLNVANYKTDPLNRIVFLKLELRQSEAIKAKDENFHLLEYALEHHGAVDPTVVKFLREDEGFIICRDASGGIECGNHGHLGANGAKPAPLQFAKMGRRQNTGHTHSCCIIDGLYVGGVTGKPRRFKYRKGPSSWSQSDIVTYPNGKRCIVTKWANKYRAA